MTEVFGKLFGRVKIGNLFYNNKFIAVFSLISSFLLWVFVSSSSSESVSATIYDIPVEISLPQGAVQDGLRIFGGKDITAKVDVTGSRIVVGQLTKNDIQVTASQSAKTIMSPGNYALELSAKKVGMLNDYTIVPPVKPSVITVMVDRYREAEFKVEADIDFTSKDGYFVGSAALSNSEVKISGPETEISKIKKVVVKGSVEGEVSETVNLKLPVTMYDIYDQPMNSETIEINYPEVEVSIPVLMKKEVGIKPKFSNIPEGINLSRDYSKIVKITPPTLEIAGPKEVVSTLQNIELPEIDFTKVTIQKHLFNLSVSLPQGCKSLNNNYDVQVDVDMSRFKEKTLSVNHFSFKNVPAGKTAKVYNKSINVNFVGPVRSINLLKSADVTAYIDLQGKEDSVNSMEVPVKLISENFKDIWCSGEYFVNVSLTDAEG